MPVRVGTDRWDWLAEPETARRSALRRVAEWLGEPQEGPMAFALDPAVGERLLETLVPGPMDFILGMTLPQAKKVFKGIAEGASALGVKLPLGWIMDSLIDLVSRRIGTGRALRHLERVGEFVPDAGIASYYTPDTATVGLVATREGLASRLPFHYAHELAHHLTYPGPHQPAEAAQAAQILEKALAPRQTSFWALSQVLPSYPLQELHYLADPYEVLANRLAVEVVPVAPLDRILSAELLQPIRPEEREALEYLSRMLIER